MRSSGNVCWRFRGYLVQDQAGAHLAGEVPATPGLAPGWTTIEVPQASEDGGRPERVRALVSDFEDGVRLAVGGDLRQIDNLEKAIATAFPWTIGLAAMLGIVGGVWLSRTFLRRVDAISRTAEAIIDGDLSRRVPTRGTEDDLDRLAAMLNHMLDRIGILMDSPAPGQQRRGSRPADATHPALSAVGRRAGACAVGGGLRGGDRRRDRRGAEITRYFFRFAADRPG